MQSRRDVMKLFPLTLPLASAAASPGPISPHTGPSAFLSVQDFGASGSGRRLDSPAINACIEAAAAAGGGTVVFPAGKYLSFSIRLKSHVHLYLSPGAVIVAAASPLPEQTTGELGGVYDAAEPAPATHPYQDYGHNHWHNSLIWGEGLEDVGIHGSGRIFGKGLSYGGRKTDKARGDYPIYLAEQLGVGNKAIALKNCRNVVFQDFSILKGGHFGLLLTGVDNLTVRNLTIDTDRDGMDLDCCRNAHVSNCTVNSPWDDGICPKSSLALGYARATENVTITGCTVTGYFELGSVLDGSFRVFPEDAVLYRTGRIKCGTESNGGFRNISIANCVFEGCNSLSLESEDGALCEDITISNITMRNLVSGPLFFRLGGRLRGPKDSTHVGSLRRILVTNIVSYNSDPNLCNILSGIPDHPIEDVKISQFYMEHRGGAGKGQGLVEPAEKIAAYPEPDMFGSMPAHGFFLRHVKNIEFAHVEVAARAKDERPAFVLEDVTRGDFIAVTTPSDSRVFDLRGARDFRVRLSRPAIDQTLPDAKGVKI